MLYRIADEIETEGRITEDAAELNGWTAERIREAAQRMDEQTVAINELRKTLEQAMAWERGDRTAINRLIVAQKLIENAKEFE